VNRYRYALNNPVLYIDPTGLFTVKPTQYLPALKKSADPLQALFNAGLRKITSAVSSTAKSVSSTFVKGANTFNSAADTATYLAAANQWLSNDFILDGSYSGGQFRGGKEFRDRGLSLSTQLELFDLYASQQTERYVRNRAGHVSFSTALFNQQSIAADVSVYQATQWQANRPTLTNFGKGIWNTVKLWDNQIVAQNYKNLRGQGSGVVAAAYGAGGTAAADLVGLSGVYDAYEGKGFYGDRLSAGERLWQGGIGSIQLVGTAAWLRAPALNAGSRIASAASDISGAFGRSAINLADNLGNIRISFDPATLSSGGLGGFNISVAPSRPTAYSVAFETQLSPAQFGLSQEQHFQIANNALRAEMAVNSALGDLVAAPTRWGRPPADWTWQHATIEQAGRRAGVLQLVPRVQHTPGSPFWPLFHPLPGGAGGYSQWAVPAGARPR
jgi:hypothetical protein